MKKSIISLIRFPLRIISFAKRELFEKPVLRHRQRTITKRIRLKQKKNQKIRISFIVQFPEMWNSIKSICDDALLDKRFDVKIICVPKFLQKSVYEKKIKFYEQNAAQEFLEQLGYKVIDARNNDGSWIKYKRFRSDYVFVQRPYNLHLPKNLRFNVLSKYSLICYTPYGYPLSKNALLKTTINYYFLKYATYYFSFDKIQLAYFNKNKFLKSSRGIEISNSARIDLLEEPLEEKKQTIHNVLWTPRWYVGNGPNGKSNFLKYKDTILDYIKKNPEMNLIIRPHPLMFENLVRVGAMTQNEVDNFKNDIFKAQNICLDNKLDYLESFSNADVLVSDFSSLLYEFILTGKPVLYCGETNDFNEIANQISSGFYNVDDALSLISRLDLLKKGNDDLFSKRFSIIDSQISKKSKISQEILNLLLCETK